MATYNSSHLAHLAGVPSQESDTIAPVAEGLIVGPNPATFTEDMTVAASQTITSVYVPVGFDGSGNLVPAVSGTTQAIGVLLRPITTGSSPIQGQPVLRGGRVAMDMIAWPASYDTTEKKLEAFRGAASPTQIVVVQRPQGATVSAP